MPALWLPQSIVLVCATHAEVGFLPPAARHWVRSTTRSGLRVHFTILLISLQGQKTSGHRQPATPPILSVAQAKPI
jgi:hypothetical protein